MENISLDHAIKIAQTWANGGKLIIKDPNETTAYHKLCLNLLYDKRDELTRQRRAEHRKAK